MNGPITITIDVLAVSGLDRSQAAAFGQALEHTLAELVLAGGVPPTAAPRDLSLSGIVVRASEPRLGGAAVARAIYRGLVR